jgi:OLD-like protein
MNIATLEQLIGHGHFFSKTLLNADDFVRYCKDRELNVSLENLERLEKIGAFSPLLRIRWPKIKIKLRPREDGDGYEDLGMLEDDEEWLGETREENGAFLWWNKDAIRWLIDEGMLWAPKQTDFQSWESYKDEDGWWSVHSYYSVFQTLSLSRCLEIFEVRVGMETIAEWSPEDATKWLADWKVHADYLVAHAGEDFTHRVAKLCQVLSSRYLPYAQSDGATIAVPHPDFFDWGKFRREWKAEEFLEEIGLSGEDIGEAWQTVNVQNRFVDPLFNWRDFVDFIKPSQRGRLKGKALLCQTWRTMERILNLFQRDLSGESSDEVDGAPEHKEAFWGKGVPNNDLRFLEFLANRFGVNPRPKVLLVVEGNGEEEQLPRMAKELLSPSFPKLRIGMVNIKGVGEIKRLSRLIDHYHSLQTIVFVILDNENNAGAAKAKLSQTPSQWNLNRTITKEEYFYIWERSIEFDNFTDREIAKGMTIMSENRFQFSPEEISVCRADFGSGRDPLSKLYNDRLEYGLVKPQLLKHLFDMAIDKPEMESGENKIRRPIVDLLITVQRLALRNHQPSHLDAWQQTQDSDWLGNRLSST